MCMTQKWKVGRWEKEEGGRKRKKKERQFETV